MLFQRERGPQGNRNLGTNKRRNPRVERNARCRMAPSQKGLLLEIGKGNSADLQLSIYGTSAGR